MRKIYFMDKALSLYNHVGFRGRINTYLSHVPVPELRLGVALLGILCEMLRLSIASTFSRDPNLSC